MPSWEGKGHEMKSAIANWWFVAAALSGRVRMWKIYIWNKSKCSFISVLINLIESVKWMQDVWERKRELYLKIRRYILFFTHKKGKFIEWSRKLTVCLFICLGWIGCFGIWFGFSCLKKKQKYWQLFKQM